MSEEIKAGAQQREDGIPVGRPFVPGQSGNPQGRRKGLRNWSTIVKQILDDESLADKVLTKQPGWWTNLPQKNMATAIAVAMGIKAMNGDEKAARWLRETGFGNKLDITSGEKPIPILGTLPVNTNDNASTNSQDEELTDSEQNTEDTETS